jgi:hypothetical protein
LALQLLCEFNKLNLFHIALSAWLHLNGGSLLMEINSRLFMKEK